MAETTAAPAAPAAKTAVDPKAAIVDPKAAPAKIEEATEEYIVNGKPVRLNKAQAKAYVQKGLFADQQLKSIDVLKKSSESLAAALKTPDGIVNIVAEMAKSSGLSVKDVFRGLLDKGLIDPDDLGKETYNRIVRTAKMSPEEVEREKKLAEYEQLKKQEEVRKKEQATAQEKQQVQQIYTAVRAEVVKQIVADKTFPQTEGSISAVVNTLRAMNKKGAPITVENVTKALEKVKKDHVLNQQAILDADKEAPDYGEKLISRIGEERALAISRALVARLKAKTKAAAKDEKKENLKDTLSRKLNVLPSGHTVMETGW